MEKQKKIRGGHRAAVTVLVQQIEVELQKEQPDADELAALSEELQKQRQTISSLDEDIQRELPEEEIESDILECIRRRKIINKCIRQAERRCTVSEQEGSSTTTDKGDLDNSKKTVKLPQINLPVFKGDPLSYPNFWDTFKHAVHDREDLSGATKFNYLTCQLRGEAAQLLSGFSRTDGDYVEALELLQSTYGQPKRLIQEHLNAIFEIQEPAATASDLSKFRSTYESHIRGLKVLEANTEESGYILAALIIRKLPSRIRDNINRAGKSDFWDLAKLRIAIEEEINHLRCIQVDEKPDSVQPKQNKFKAAKTVYKPTPRRVHEGSASALNVATTSKKYGCQLCKEEHKVFECTSYQTVDARKARVAELGLCFNCLREGHRSFNCNNMRRCRECKKKHHTILCDKQNENPNKTPEHGATALNVGINDSSKINVQSTLLPIAIAPIMLKNGNSKNVRCLFDQGSQRTFVLRSLVDSLHMRKIKKVSETIDSFNMQGSTKEFDIVQFSVATLDGPVLVDALVVENFPSRISMPGRSDAVEHMNLKGFILADPTDKETFDDLQIIVGGDQYYNFVYGQAVRDKIHLIPSKLGAMLAGTTANSVHGKSVSTLLHVASQESPLKDELDLQRLWETDVIGITPDKTPDSSEDSVFKHFESTLQYSDGKYNVKLPWRPDHSPLPDNYNLAKGRLRSLLSKLRKDQEMLQRYDDLIKGQIDNDFIEEVNELSPPQKNLVHYLPHHCVQKESTSTPIRIVYDCSSKTQPGVPSLNDCLYSGPSLLQDLGKVLLKFRTNKYACCGDISKAFLRIGLDEEDRDVTRFLWIDDVNDPNSKIKIYRFKVVLFGSTASQFLMCAVIKHHLKKFDCSVARDLERGMYADNVYFTDNTEEGILNFYDKSREIMSSANLYLHQWASNSMTLCNSCNEDLSQSYETPMVLGLVWDTADDLLSYPSRQLEVTDNVTKRGVLQTTARIFDPLGWISPVTIKSRMFLQELWRTKVGWDEELNDEFKCTWRKLVDDLKTAITCKLSREVSFTSNTQIHAFSDASMKAYGSVVYTVTDDKVDLIIAKARVTPIKCPTLPQLELTAANLSARLVDYVLKSYESKLDNAPIYCWTDSSIVLHWLQSKKPLKAFIKRRVGEICHLLPNAEWKYVNSCCNPADLLSRGMTAKAYFKSSLWHQGPGWLKDPSKWPATISSLCASDEKTAEVSETCTVLPATITEPEDKVIKIERFSSLAKLLRVTALVLKFINLLRNKIAEPRSDCANTRINDLSIKEMETAEILWIKTVQKEVYGDILQYLQSNSHGRAPSIIRQLEITLTDGVLRCGGRFSQAHLDDRTKFPILLPPNHPFTMLVIKNTHQLCKHGGPSMTVAHIRQNWWIPRCRQRVKAALRQCTLCRKVCGKSYDQPPHPPLPSFRTQIIRPFQITGLDYTGALLVRTQGRETKAYVALFTCAVTRAVHLELVPDNTTRSFLQAFRRFVSRRSIPRLLISDNASTFVAASNILKKICNDPEVKENLLSHRVEWSFITPRAPWEGGFYERLIGVTKRVLKKCLGRSFVTFDELHTLVTEAEAIINDRPISYVSNDLSDDLPISPSHLLHGHLITTLPVCGSRSLNINEIGQTAADLGRRMRYRAKLLENFWKRWQTDYLVALRERHQWSKRNLRKVSINDVVLIKNSSPRLTWKLGRIVKLHPSRDRYVRVVTVRTSSGELVRPVSLLYPIECEAETLPLYQLSSPQKDDDPQTEFRCPAAQSLDGGQSSRFSEASPAVLVAEQLGFDLGIPSVPGMQTNTPTNQPAAVPSKTSTTSTSARPTREAALKARLRWQNY